MSVLSILYKSESLVYSTTFLFTTFFFLNRLVETSSILLESLVASGIEYSNRIFVAELRREFKYSKRRESILLADVLLIRTFLSPSVSIYVSFLAITILPKVL